MNKLLHLAPFPFPGWDVRELCLKGPEEKLSETKCAQLKVMLGQNDWNPDE